MNRMRLGLTSYTLRWAVGGDFRFGDRSIWGEVAMKKKPSKKKKTGERGHQVHAPDHVALDSRTQLPPEKRRFRLFPGIDSRSVWLVHNCFHISDGSCFMRSSGKPRSRLVAFALLPGICFFWFIGWSLCWIGERSSKPNHRS